MVSSNPASYDFVTPSMGWASLVVLGPAEGAGRIEVFRTVDGAKHWQLQLTGDSSNPGFSPISVQFFGKTRGFMIIGGPVEQLYRSDDEGAHWARLVLRISQIDVITFSSETYGWMLASASSGRPGQRFNLYVTSDAGQTWQRLPDPPADTIGLSFRRPTEAWLGSYGPSPPHVYTSSDAGQSWQRHDLPAPPGGWDPTLAFQAFGNLLPGAGVMVGASGECRQPGCSSSTGSFYFTSSDSGVHWRSVLSLPGIPAYQDSMNWWAMSANEVFKSRDAGQSWTQVATLPQGQQFSITGIVDSTHAWTSVILLGGYGLALTNDGGLHWTLAKIPQPL
jgi:photosystem II stability/assembly factor-like uncharacterized protein